MTTDSLEAWCWRLNAALDADIEIAQREEWALGRLLAHITETLCTWMPLSRLALRTTGEDLQPLEFVFPFEDKLTGVEAALLQSEPKNEAICQWKDHTLLLFMQVAGDPFGSAIFTPSDAAWDKDRFTAGARVFLELVDNMLVMVHAAAKKQAAITAIHAALKDPILDDAINQAVAALHHYSPLTSLFLIHREEEEASTVVFRFYENGKLTGSTQQPMKDGTRQASLQMEAAALIDGALPSQEPGMEEAESFWLQGGALSDKPLGRVFALRPNGGGTPGQRDLFSSFAAALQLRMVDFFKEIRLLSQYFGPVHLTRLLNEEDYDRRFLTPREREVGILYTDISGFTRISEQSLKVPGYIGAFIDAWSERAVDLVWRHGGMFDKMVGDCIIAIFGPPFYEEDNATRCRNVLNCAAAIRDMTAQMGCERGYGVPGLPKELPPMGVATGVNFAPLFIGRFGPNRDVTGFSSGMNNTARLQGVAKQNEILVMDQLIAALGEDGAAYEFGPPGEASVKNVAEPLRYQPLIALK